MKNLSPTIINWFKHKILETYGNPEIKKIPLPPVVEWEEQSVPYFETETYTEKTDAGIQAWLYFISAGTGLFALFIIISGSLLSGLFISFASIAFFFYGKKNFRKTTEIIKEKKVQKTRVEKIRKEIPQFREETVSGKWSIKRMGTGALKFGVAKVNETKLLCGIDFSRSFQNFNFPEINSEKKFISDFYHLEEQLAKTPFILDGEKESFDTMGPKKQNIPVSLRGLEKEIMNHFIETEYSFALYKNKEISASLMKESVLKDFLLKTAEPFPLYEDDLLAVIQGGDELNHICRRWLDQWPEWNKILQDFRFESVTGQVIPEFIRFSNQTHYGGFNFYCPDCNKEIAEELMRRDYSVHNDQDLSMVYFSKNTRCHYLLGLNTWQCPMCKKIIPAPIPVHKALDEILLPVYNNLMEENKIEREKDHFDVRKKEIHYRNEKRKELEKMYFDNVSGILELRDTMEKMKAEIDGETEAIHFINDFLIRYKNLQSDIITDIEQSNEELKFQIQSTRQKILADVNRIKDTELELLGSELTELSKARRLDDELRDSIQRQILKNTEDAVKTNNAIRAARNEETGVNPYDNSFILRPVRSKG